MTLVRGLVSAGVLLLLGVTVPGFASAAAPAARPTIVLIVTDDQRWDTVTPDVMPLVQRELVDQGTTFTNAFAPNPLCCPSRASILTGQFSHGTGVWANGGEFGGFGAFDDSTTVATRLQARGYRTILVGKYLNGYRGTTYIPPGWDDWFAFASPRGSGGQAYYDYTINDNGTTLAFGSAPSDYSTDVLAAEAAARIRSTEGPLFLYFAPNAPHFDGNLSTSPPPRYAGHLDGLEPWRPPSYDEADVSDKPPWIQRRPRLTPEDEAAGDRYRQGQLEALMGVDDAVGLIVDALRTTGRLDNSLIVFTSDNGLLWGEHRRFTKTFPYEESIRVPMVVRYDPYTQSTARRDGHLVLNVDLAPTFTSLAGTTMPGAQGRSFLPLVRRRGTTWRTDFPVESAAPPIPPPYCGVRSARYAYAQYRGGAEELYALVRDRYELDNLARDPAWRKAVVQLRLRARRLCRPAPPSMTMRSPCLVRGDSAANNLRGTRFYDYICGRGSGDRVSAYAGDDDVFGDNGPDVLYGGDGDDYLRGGYGADRLYGRDGDDRIRGGPDADWLYGGRGRDRIEARDGRAEVVDCGHGRDAATVDRRDTVRRCEKVLGPQS